MGTYYYVSNPETKDGMMPIYEDNYIAAILQLAKKSGMKITDKMILMEVKSHWQESKKEKSSKKMTPNRRLGA